jgi:lauroyl/myristoyl acyltransferase
VTPPDSGARGWARLRDFSVPLALRSLSRLPLGLTVEAFAVASVAQAALRPSRARRARRWATAVARSPIARWRLTVATLAEHGRLFALSVAPAYRCPGEIRHRLAVDSREHLDRALRDGGAILLGFHTAPGLASLALVMAGYRLTVAGDARTFARWQPGHASWKGGADTAARQIPLGDTASRGAGLNRAREVLGAGGLVYMTADGPEGREAFRIPVPAGEVVVRAGWWALRRHTGAAVLPVLVHREGSRVVATVHPPLPAPRADPEVDLAACRAVLVDLLDRHLRRVPVQGLGLALSASRPPSPPAPSGLPR